MIIEKNIKLNNVNRVLDLFDVYWNENITIINPIKKPGYLQVKEKLLKNQIKSVDFK
jgi:hypothetical protein